jgi:FKBP-type peptidyl-prolyl cis-trans isomerase FkpA
MNFKYKTKTMKQFFCLAATAMVVLAGCKTPFKKAGEGIEYKIISDGKGKQLKDGNFFELSVEQKYKGTNKDTVLYSSSNEINQIAQLDSSQTGPQFYKIFSQARLGDSIVIKQTVDSLMKRGAQLPPYMKKGGNIFLSYKIVNVFETKAGADSSYAKLMGLKAQKDSLKAIDQAKKDDKTIADYLKSKNIQAVKAPKGTFVQIINPGEGDAADTSKVLKVFYTGKNFEDGKSFDSNIDPTFGHSDPIYVHLNMKTGLIQGWFDGLSLFKKGTKGVLYIPSGLAYGAQGKGGAIKPNANLVFDIEVADVISSAQAKIEEEEAAKKQQAEQKRMIDSMKREQQLRDTSGKK